MLHQNYKRQKKKKIHNVNINNKYTIFFFFSNYFPIPIESWKYFFICYLIIYTPFCIINSLVIFSNWKLTNDTNATEQPPSTKRVLYIVLRHDHAWNSTHPLTGVILRVTGHDTNGLRYSGNNSWRDARQVCPVGTGAITRAYIVNATSHTRWRIGACSQVDEKLYVTHVRVQFTQHIYKYMYIYIYIHIWK